MAERDDLLSRLRSVDEILAGARPRASREAELLAKLRAADRARQSPPSPSLALSTPQAWRPLGVTAALCAAFALALALRAGDSARRSAEPSTSRGDEIEARAFDREAPTPRLVTTTSAPQPRAEAPWPRSTPREDRSERRPTTPPPILPEAPPRRAPWDSALPSPAPQLSSSDDPLLQSDAWPSAPDAQLSRSSAPAPSRLDEPRVLWADSDGHSGVTPKPASAPARRGEATSAAPVAEPRADGCEAVESLIDRARADCESQGLTLSDQGLATRDACSEGRFRGLDYACAPAHPPKAPPSSKAPAGCFAEELPLDGSCKSEEEMRLEALQWCEEAGLSLGGVTLAQGGCGEGGFEGAYLLCCEKDPEGGSDKVLPRIKPACTEEDDPDCEQE